MRYITIAGEFHIHYPDTPRTGPQPDGDTISFKADNRSLIEALPRFGDLAPEINRRGVIGVRFEAIDALETHFRGSHQESELAYRARDFMLEYMGFRDVVFFDDMPDVVRSVSNNPRRGYILANGIDGNGRVIAFAYPDRPTQADGTRTFVDPGLMRSSANLAILNAGLAYAAIYTSLPLDLANDVRAVTGEIRSRRLGIFGRESLDTERSAHIDGLDVLETMVIWPKLYRRLVSFFSAGHSDLAELDRWLREDPINRDDRMMLPDGEFGNMHDLIVVENGALRMNYNPEDVTILPDNA